MRNSQKKELFSQLTNRQAWLILTLYIFFMIVLAVLLQHIVDREWLRNTVANAGSLGFIIFLFIEYLYIIFVPVYNTAIHLAAGYIFGGDIGWILNFIATSAGLFTIIILVKRYGRPLLRKVINKKIYDKYDNLSRRMGPIALFVVYVLPLFPDDEITYLIAAGRVKFGRFILPVLLGNVTKSAVSYIGDKGVDGFQMAIGTRIIVLVVGLIIIGAQEFYFNRNEKVKEKRGDQ